MSTLTVFFYVQHLLGVGHLARASRITDALRASGADITLAIGGMPVAGFPSPGTKSVQLPPVRSADEGFSTILDREGREIDEAFKAGRRAHLIAAFEEARPDVLMIEAYPFARRKLAFELRPLVERAKSLPDRPIIATSVRDIQQENTKPERVVEIGEVLRQFFDLILVHGDPAFARLEETFALPADVFDRVRYTGLVAPPRPSPSPDVFDIVVSAGGGAAGRRLLSAAVDAARRLPPDLHICLITGPNLAPDEQAKIRATAPANVRIEAFRTDFRSLLASARLSVSQAGYNTVGDLLQAGIRMVLVPFTGAGETEQRTRAERLGRLGLATVLSEETLSGAVLTEAITRALALPPPSRPDFDMAGAARTVEILRETVADRRRGRV